MSDKAFKRTSKDFKLNSRGSNKLISTRWSDTEVTQLASMRNKLKEELTRQSPFPDVVGDRRLLRFLRGKQHKVDDAVKQYSEFLKWRKDNKVDDIRAEILYGGKNTPFLFPNGKKILDHAPQIVISSKALDKKGQPLAMEMYNFSPHKLFKEITLQEYMVFLTYSLEYRALVMEQMSEEAEQRYLAEHPTEAERQTLNGYGVVLLDFTIRDLKGVSLSHLSAEGRKLIKAALDVGIPNYPEYLGKCYMANVPWVFNTCWHFIKGLLDEQTLAKISLSASGDILETLQKDISMESIPKTLGGTFELFNEPYVFDTSDTGPFYCPVDLIVHNVVSSPMPSIASCSSSYDDETMGKLLSPSSCASGMPATTTPATTTATATSKRSMDDLGSVQHDIGDSIAGIAVEQSDNNHPRTTQRSSAKPSVMKRKSGSPFTPDRGDIEVELLALRDERKGYSVSFNEFVPQNDWLDGRWVQPGNSVYGVIIGHLLMSMELDYECFRKGYPFLLQQAILIGFLHGYLVYALWMALPTIDQCLLSSALWPLMQVGLVFFLLLMVPALVEICNELYMVVTARYVFQYDVSDGEASVQKLRRSRVGVFLAAAVVLYEAAVNSGVLVVGMTLITTRASVLEVIMATMVMTAVRQVGHTAVFIYGKDAELAQTSRYRTEALLYPPTGFTEAQHRTYLRWTAMALIAFIFVALAAFRSFFQSC